MERVNMHFVNQPRVAISNALYKLFRAFGKSCSILTEALYSIAGEEEPIKT